MDLGEKNVKGTRRMLRISWKDKISNEIVLFGLQSQRMLTKPLRSGNYSTGSPGS